MINGFVVRLAVAIGAANEPPPPPPVLTPATMTTLEDTPVTTTLTAPRGARLRLRTGPRRGAATLDEPTAQLRYVPNKDVNGDDDVVIEITLDGRQTQQTLTVSVTPVNDPPVVGGLTLTTKEDTAVTARLAASDVEGDPLRFTIAEQPITGTATVDDTGTVVFTPGKNVVGEAAFTVVVDDGHGGETSAVVSVKISAVNDAPTVTATPIAGNEDETIIGTVTAADVDGDDLTFAIGRGPKNGAAMVDARGQLRYTPTANFNGTDRFVVVVKDPDGLSASATVEVTISPVNDPPTARALELKTVQDRAVEGVVAARDVDGDVLSFAVEASADCTSTIDERGRLRFTPRRGFSGKTVLAVVVSDGRGGQVTVVVGVHVAPTPKR